MEINITRRDVVGLRKPQDGVSLWQVALLHDLGYAFPTDIDNKLPVQFYSVTAGRKAVRLFGPFVLVREVVMDGTGFARFTRRGKQKTRTVVRRLP